MDAEMIKAAGQIAGIGGVALGVFLILFREVIRKSIFPMLMRAQAYQLLKLIVILAWSIALVGIGAWVWTENRDQTDAHVEATGGVAVGGNVVNSPIVVNPIPAGGKTDEHTAQ